MRTALVASSSLVIDFFGVFLVMQLGNLSNDSVFNQEGLSNPIDFSELTRYSGMYAAVQQSFQ